MNNNRRLTRSRTDRMIGGVCGGLANYLGLDATLVRIVFLLLVVVAGVSPLAYLILWVIVPDEYATAATWTQQVQQTFGEIRERATTVAHEVQSQVQKVTGSSGTPGGPSETEQQDPSTGPTRRL